MNSTAKYFNSFVLNMTGSFWMIPLFVVIVPHSAEVGNTDAELQETFHKVEDAFILIPSPDRTIIFGQLQTSKSIPGYPLTSDSTEVTETDSGIGIRGRGPFIFDSLYVKGSFNREGITFTLFSRTNPNGVQIRRIAELKHINKRKKVVMVTHGWMSSGDSESCTTIKDNFLNKSNVNVVIMDWGDIANNLLYPVVASQTTKVAAYCTKFLNSLIKKTGVRHRDIHLIGHSLGAHILGFCAGHIRNGKIGRISGLDPAQPGFLSIHLNTTQASFVFVIHTDGGLLGMWRSIGHVDFYPNCGVAPQPGCEIPLFWNYCSHAKSWELFAESIRKPYQAICSSTPVKIGAGKQIIAAIECSCFTHIKCHNNFVKMGAVTPSEARGSFYLRTD